MGAQLAAGLGLLGGWAGGKALDAAYDWATTPDTTSRINSHPLDSTSSRTYPELFNVEQQKHIQDAAIASYGIGTYKKNGTGLDALFESGWRVHESSDNRVDKAVNSLDKNYQDRLPLYEKQGIASFKRMELDQKKSGIKCDQIPHYSLCLVNDDKKILMQVTMGGPRSLFEKEGKDIADAIECGKIWKAEKQFEGYSFLATGEGFGGECAHFVAMKLDGHAVGFDIAPLDQQLLNAFQLDTRSVAGNHVIITSDPEKFTQGDSFGTILGIQNPISDKSKIIDEINQGKLKILSHATSQPTTQASSDLSDVAQEVIRIREQIDSRNLAKKLNEELREEISVEIRKGISEFREDAKSIFNGLNTRSVPDEVLNQDECLTQEQFNSIEKISKTIDQEEIPKMDTTAIKGDTLLAKLKQVPKEDYAKAMGNILDQVAAAYSLHLRQKLSQKREQIQIDQLCKDFEAKTKKLNGAANRDLITPPYVAIETMVWNAMPSLDNIATLMKNANEDLRKYKEIHQSLKKEIRERKELAVDIRANIKKLNILDDSIKKNFKYLLDARDKAIKSYGNVQTGLEIVGSIATNIASIFNPAAGAIGKGCFSLAQTFFGGEATHEERERMKLVAKFTDYMNWSLGERETAVNQKSKVKEEIHSLEQQQIAQVINLLHKDTTFADPEKIRKGLIKAKNVVAEEISTKKGLIEKKEAEINELEERKNRKNQVKELKKQIEEIDDKIKKQQEITNKKIGKHVARSLKKQKNAGGLETLAELMLEKASKENELEILKKVDKTKEKMNLIGVTNKINEINIEIKDLGLEIENLETVDDELDIKIENEANLAPIKKYFHAIFSEYAKSNPVTPETAKRQKEIDNNIALFHELRRGQNEIAGALAGKFDQLFQELATGPLFSLIFSMLPQFIFGKDDKEINLNKNFINEKFKKFFLHAQNLTKLINQIHGINNAFETYKMTAGLLNQINLGDYAIDFLYMRTGLEKSKNFIPDVPYLKPCLDFVNPSSCFKGDLNQFGEIRYIQNYLLPAVEVLTGALGVLRLVSHIYQGCPGITSIEEQKLKKIEEFLKEHHKHLDKQFDSLRDILDKNNKEVLDQFDLIHSAFIIVTDEIISKIEISKNEVINVLHNNEYGIHTKSIEEKGIDVAKAKDRLKEHLSTFEPNKQLEEIHKFLTDLQLILRYDTVFGRNTGICEGTPPTELVNIEYVQRNPDMYSGMIAFKIGSKVEFEKSKSVGSLYLLNLAIENYVFALKAVKSYPKNEKLLKKIMECEHLIIEQSENLHELNKQLDPLIRMCREEQDRYLESPYENLEFMTSLKKKMMTELFSAAKKEHLETLSKQFVGAHKFRLGEIFSSEQIKLFHRSDLYRETTQWGVDTLYSFAWTAVGAVAFGPIAAVCILSPAIGFGNRYIKEINFLKKFNQLTISKLAQSRSSQKEYELFDNNRITMRVWMAASGALSSEVFFTSFINFERKGKTANESLEQSNEMTPFGADFELDIASKHVHIISNKSLIKVEELEALQHSLHTRDKEQYDGSLKKLLTDYQLWLKITVDGVIEKGNIFSSIHKHKDPSHRFVPSSDPDLVPLAFPDKLLKELENRMDSDRTLIETHGVGFLTLAYDFRKIDDDRFYKLSIQYFINFSEEDKFKTRLYEEFEVAYIDQNTVKAFAKPTFSVNESTVPSLNEFLIQAMYTSFVEHLGMPGDQSVSLGGGRWLAPSERLFPGFYKLWEKEPSAAIHFNHRRFTEKMSQSLNVFTSGVLDAATGQDAQEHADNIRQFLRRVQSKKQSIKIKIWKQIYEAKQISLEKKKKLEENYHLLFAYFQLFSSLDKISLSEKLKEDFGILDPGKIDSVDANLSVIEASKLERFKQILDRHPSDHYKLIKRLNEPQVVTKAPPAPASSYRKTAPQPFKPSPVLRNELKQLAPSVYEGTGLPNRGNTCWMNAAIQLLSGSGTLMSQGIKDQLSPYGGRQAFIEEISSTDTPDFDAIKRRCQSFDVTLQPKIQWEDYLGKMNECLEKMQPLSGIGIDLHEFAQHQLSNPDAQAELNQEDWYLINSYWVKVRGDWNKANPNNQIDVISASKKVEYDTSSIVQLTKDLKSQIFMIAYLDKVLTLLSKKTDSRNDELAASLDRLNALYLDYENSRKSENEKFQKGEQFDSIEWLTKLIGWIGLPEELRGTIIEGVERVATSFDALPVAIPDLVREDKECPLSMLIQMAKIQTTDDNHSSTFLSSESDSFYVNISRTAVNEYGSRVKLMHDISDIDSEGKVALDTRDQHGEVISKAFAVTAAIIHDGTGIEGGHYVCVRRNTEGDYFLYNDDRVSPLTKEDAIKKMKKAYFMHLKAIN